LRAHESNVVPLGYEPSGLPVPQPAVCLPVTLSGSISDEA